MDTILQLTIPCDSISEFTVSLLLDPPGVADNDGQAGGEEGEHEEELLGGPALAVQDDRAGAHAQIQPELAPHCNFQ